MTKLNGWTLIGIWLLGSTAYGAVGFGSRKTVEPVVASPQANTVAAAPANSEPPAIDGVEWLRVPHEKAENEVLALFQQDLPKVAEVADSLAIYDVRTSGQLPANYHRSFKSKLERVVLTSPKLKIKDCTGCDEARLIRSSEGQVRYEANSAEVGRTSKMASQLGVAHFLLADLDSTPEDLRLRVRMIEASTGNLKWSKEYSTADIIKTREAVVDSGAGELGHSDSLARVIIGEIVFTTVLSPGFTMVPTIDNGSGSQLTGLPSFDLFIGERFDRNRKAFGFQLGAMVNPGISGGKGTPLPWAIKVAPQFRYFFNPYNMTTARYSLNTEVGGIISTGLGTAYFGIGPEIAMINRFSVSLMPIYILGAKVAGAQTFFQQADNSFTSNASTAGSFGGFGMVMKVSINW